MAVNRNGEMEGSIGGGIMEHKFVEMAKEQLRQTDEHTTGGSIKKQIHDKSAGSNQSRYDLFRRTDHHIVIHNRKG
jgi:xanthine dehydrogenase accessory factor